MSLIETIETRVFNYEKKLETNLGNISRQAEEIKELLDALFAKQKLTSGEDERDHDDDEDYLDDEGWVKFPIIKPTQTIESS